MVSSIDFDSRPYNRSALRCCLWCLKALWSSTTIWTLRGLSHLLCQSHIKQTFWVNTLHFLH